MARRSALRKYSESELIVLKKRAQELKPVRIVIAIAAILVTTWILVAVFVPGPKYKLTNAISAPLDSDEFLYQLEAMTNSRITRGNLIEPLHNGDVFYRAELDAIRGAKQSTNVEAYIFQRGEIAERFRDVVTERARNGVNVRLTLDAMGSFSTPKRYFKEFRNAGGKIEFYHPLRWNTWMRSNYRTHRELVVIDGQTAFLGGAGIADHWLKQVKDDPQWRDQMFRIRGDAVRGLQGAFLENWLEASGELLAGEQFFPKQGQHGSATCLVVTSTPSRGGSTRARVLFQALIAGAKKSIQITTPYFLPEQSLRDELIKAKHRGVNVRILVPGAKSDHLMTRSSSRRVYGPLLEAGIEIHEYQPSMLHAKIMVLDGVWSVLGSTNFDNRSFGLNDEINLAALDSQLANYLTEEFNRDLEKSNSVSFEQWKKRPVWERVVETFGALLERQQ